MKETPDKAAPLKRVWKDSWRPEDKAMESAEEETLRTENEASKAEQKNPSKFDVLVERGRQMGF